MSKKVKLGCDQATEEHSTDWSLCILCQKKSTVHLTDPYNSTSRGTPTGYKSLAENLEELHCLDALPTHIKLSRLNDGSGIESTLMTNHAKWHKPCWLLCSKTRIDRARKRKEAQQDEPPTTPVKSRLRSNFSQANFDHRIDCVCFFCDEKVDMTDRNIHKAATPDLDKNVRTMATELRDTKLLAKMSCGDLTALDAVYHKKCLTALHTRYRSLSRKADSPSIDDLKPESVALAQLMSYMEDRQQCEHPVGSIFKLSELVKLYTQRLEQLGADLSSRVNPTRLKEKLLLNMPHIEANKSKYEVILTFKKDLGDALLLAHKEESDNDAIVLMRAAQIVRKQIFQTKYHFQGSLDDDQYDMLPQSLVALVQMILGGTTIQNQHDNCNDVRSVVSSLTQLLVFNSMKRSRTDTTGIRHNTDRETALPLYLGLLIHAKTRKRQIVDELFSRGLSVSYDRVMQLSTDLGNDAIQTFEKDGVVCPRSLRTGLFTTGNLDNIDHDPSSTSALSSFHGTAISLTQHCSTSNSGVARDHATEETDTKRAKSINTLPETYTTVNPATYHNEKPLPLELEGPLIPGDTLLSSDTGQSTWLDKINRLLQESQEVPDDISWSAHFASLQDIPRPPAITGLLPLFRDNAHSLAMVKHGMDVIQKATQLVNPGQTPVIVMDQPLYAIGKKIQWSWPLHYGEERYVVMLGGLHIEMALLNVMGDWLNGSGWAAVMATANVTTEGRADALQKGSYTSRAQWAHQVTAAALYILQRRAYAAHQEAATPEDTLTFENWCQHMESAHPQFQYWSKVLKLELLFLQFLRSQREANFQMYVETLGKIIPWMFAMDHIHYARWLTVHVIDMLRLQSRCPAVNKHFVEGNFVTQKSSHKFSTLAHDQVHEQQNAILKGDGGIIGITEDQSALKRWMVAGPEISRVLNEFESRYTHKSGEDYRHHEQIHSVQKRFASNTKNVVEAIEEMGNPFLDDSSDLVALDTKLIMSETVVNNMQAAEQLGKTQYEAFVDERISGSSKPFYDPIQKNNLTLFKSGKMKTSQKSSKAAAMKSDVQLFSRLYISCQSRDGDLDSFFEHENHPWPPSLAENNTMRHASKADLMDCLEALAPRPVDAPEVDVTIIDGAALMYILDPKQSNKVVRTFGEFAQLIFLPYILTKLQSVIRLDVVWDVYKDGSLKSCTRELRGTGEPLRVAASTRLPQNWKTFLRGDSNKTGLFKFLASELASCHLPEGKLVLTTCQEKVLSNPDMDVHGLTPCTQDEADGRMLLHASHAYQQGQKRVLIQATDTDVVVLAIRTANILKDCELWVAFGHGKHFRYIAAHSIADELDDESCQGLLFLHAISGCDTVSAFCGIGKKTAWEVWRTSDVFKSLFSRLSLAPSTMCDADLVTLERFVVLLYQRTSPLLRVNEARKRLFAFGNRKLENIPPTRAALMQHAKRAAFQAGHVWGQSLVANVITPSPADWGWENVGGTWSPVWSSLGEASKVCRELVKCACKSNCTGRCKCYKSNLPCTQLCACGGQCIRH